MVERKVLKSIAIHQAIALLVYQELTEKAAEIFCFFLAYSGLLEAFCGDRAIGKSKNYPGETLHYDPNGNRIRKDLTIVRTFTENSMYYANTERLKYDTNYAFTYDEAGNLVEKGNTVLVNGEPFPVNSDEGIDYLEDITDSIGSIDFVQEGEGVEYWKYEFDLLNRLTRVEKNNTIIAEYTYDPDGIRTSKTVNGVSIHYVYEGNSLIFEKNIDTGEVKSFVYAFGKPIARVDGTTDDENAGRYYFSTDHLGSIRNVTNATGEVVWKGEFSAFGVLLFEEIVDEGYEADIVYAGHEWDGDVGLYYAKARWYDASTGRFVSVDPIKDGLNWFVYCANNPIAFVDPFGLFPDADGDGVPDAHEEYEQDINTDAPKDFSIREFARYEGLSDYVFQYLQQAQQANPGLFEGLDDKTKALLCDALLHTAQLYLWSQAAGKNWKWGKFFYGLGDQTLAKIAWLGNEVNMINRFGPVGYMLIKSTQGALFGINLADQIQKYDGLFELFDRSALGIINYIKNNPEEVAGRATSEIVQAILIAKGVAKLSEISKATAVVDDAAGTGRPLFNFGKTAGKHMLDPARKVPIQILDDVIMNTKGFPDPKGSNALMHYSTIWKNGKLYNLEVLYDKATNSIWHFKYTPKAIGPLPATKG